MTICCTHPLRSAAITTAAAALTATATATTADVATTIAAAASARFRYFTVSCLCSLLVVCLITSVELVEPLKPVIAVVEEPAIQSHVYAAEDD
jgi:hypothetical protein